MCRESRDLQINITYATTLLLAQSEAPAPGAIISGWARRSNRELAVATAWTMEGDVRVVGRYCGIGRVKMCTQIRNR
jgi:hypothetical protein